MSTHTTIAWSVSEGVGRIELNRPENLNGITNTMMRELWELLSKLARDRSVAVVILTGRGRTFCPGADLKHYSAGAADEPLLPEYFEIPVLLHEMPQITIAAINGACAGAGLGWALACDLRYVARSARLNTAFLDVAVAGDMGIPWTLPRLIGAGRARELSMFPRKLDAAEAVELGMVNALVDDDDLPGFVAERAARLAAAAPLARRGLKQNYVAAESTSFAELVALESERHLIISASEDCGEAFRAYIDKRTPVFRGR